MVRKCAELKRMSCCKESCKFEDEGVGLECEDNKLYAWMRGSVGCL